MSLNDISVISQIIASIAVVASLVAVVVSLRQNTRAQRLASVRRRSNGDLRRHYRRARRNQSRSVREEPA